MSQLQELSTYRNWLKFRLTGMYIPFDNEKLTILEKTRIKKINDYIRVVINDFDNNSGTLGLKVPEYRCYYEKCRCKVTRIIDFGLDTEVKLCKKHFNEYLDYYDLGTVSEVDGKTT